MCHLDCLVLFLYLFPVKQNCIKKYMTSKNVSRNIYFENSIVLSGISPNVCYAKLCKRKWFGFCFNRTLRVIFKVLSGC